MLRSILASLILPVVMLSLPAFNDIKFVKTKVGENITLLLPREFSPMTEVEVPDRYLSYRSAMALYSSPDRQIDFSVNRSYTRWRSSDLELMQEFYRSTIMNLYNEVEFITDEIRTINGRQFVVFEFISTVRSEESAFRQKVIRKYTYVQYTIYDMNPLVFNFTAPAHYKNDWQDPAEKIMESIKIK